MEKTILETLNRIEQTGACNYAKVAFRTLGCSHILAIELSANRCIDGETHEQSISIQKESMIDNYVKEKIIKAGDKLCERINQCTLKTTESNNG